MKKIMLTATALLLFAGSNASAITIHSSFSDKPKTTAPSEPGPGTSVVPGCPRNDPDGCGIYEGIPPR